MDWRGHVHRLWCCTAVTCALLATGAAQGQDPHGVAAVVNNTPISRKAVEEIVSGIAAVRGEEERTTRKQQWEESALESLIDFELLYQEAKRAGVQVDAKAIEQELQRIEKKFGEQTNWQRALAERGWSLEDLRNDTERALVVQRFLETVVWRALRIDSRQVEEFYARHRDEFRHPEQVRVRHIVVEVRTGAEEEWSDAERKADAIRRRWLTGTARPGKDPADEAGEDLGWVARGDLDPDVENMVFRMESGQVSEPLRRADGIHLFVITARRPAGLLPIEEVRPKIEEVLRKRERQRLRDELVSRLRQQAEIRYP